MREIKFRAWDGKQMRLNVGILPSLRHPVESVTFDFDSLKAMTNILPIDFDQYPLMQYTGLKDKNGVEIYESDLIRFKFYENESELDTRYSQAIVLWSNISCGFAPMSESPIAFESIEVIGDIYESPELLKDKDGN